MDKDNNVDVSVYQGDVKQKSCGTLQLTYGLEQSDQIYTLLCNTEGDTVKLSKSTTGLIVVCEVVVTTTGKILQRKMFQFKIIFWRVTPQDFIHPSRDEEHYAK